MTKKFLDSSEYFTYSRFMMRSILLTLKTARGTAWLSKAVAEGGFS